MSSPEWSRRRFLSVFPVLGAVIMLRPQELLKAGEAELSFGQVVEFINQLKSVYESLPDYHVPLTQQILSEIVADACPRFQTYGFNDKVFYPDSYELADMDTEREGGADTIAGATDCDYAGVTKMDGMMVGTPKKRLKINQKVNEFDSWWFQSKSTLAWVIHELAHVAQEKICTASFLERSDFEAAAQVATAEVMAGMALDGDQLSLYSFINFMMTLAIDAARYLAIQNPDNLPEFDRLLASICHSDDDRRMQALKAQASSASFRSYGYEPLRWLLEAHFQDGDFIEGLPFENTKVRLSNFGALMTKLDL